jgi:hypothetical protein
MNYLRILLKQSPPRPLSLCVFAKMCFLLATRKIILMSVFTHGEERSQSMKVISRCSLMSEHLCVKTRIGGKSY